MKKYILLGLVILSAVAYGATTFTTNYSLNKPGDRDRNYGQLLRDNFDTIDSQMKINETSISDHLADTVDAHDASAISATAGTFLCTTVDNVQSYLDCLDGTFDPSVSGVVLLSGVQTITGLKTFSTTPKFSGLSDGIMSITSGDGTIATGTFGSLDPLTTKGDILTYDTDSQRLAVGTDDQVLSADSSTATGLAWADRNPRWRKVTIPYTSFSAAATSFSATGITLLAAEGIQSVIIKHTTAFSGGSITAYTVEVGTNADTDLYSSAFDVFQAVASTTRQLSNILDVPDFGSTTDVVVTARSTGDNLDQATAGSVDVYLRTFTLP